MTEPTDDLRDAVANAIRNAPISTNAFAEADAAIAAYEAHRPRPDVTLTREEWDQAAIGIYSAAYRIKWGDPTSFDAFEAISAAFPWLKVEGE